MLGLTQPLTEMSVRNLPEGNWQPVHKADNLTAILRPTILNNVGTLTSHSPRGLNGLSQA
jgi:hypothetical protein